ncbi:hypothetical protein DXG01_004157 [Tephrocybe rancida]|nr:hypothetical protein DXG01_004157 [Tephrocybe rancida]
MQRRSKRLRTAPKGYIVDPVTSDSEGSDSPDRKGAVNYAGKRKVKRVAKRASTTRGKRGKLEKMSDLPLDILFEDSLVELMERARAARLEIEFSATIKTRSEVLAGVLDTYASSQPLHTILPPLADVAILPPFKVVIQDTPAAEEVTALHFQKAMTNFSQAVTKWRQSTDESLVKLINCHPATEVKVTTTILRDPATFFHCLQCLGSISYPRILVEHVSSWHHITSATASGLIQVANLSLAEQILAELLEYNKMNPASEHKCHAYSWVCLECKKVVPWPKSLKHLKEKHPNNIPVDFTEDQHGKTPDRSFTLHLDADRTILCAPIKVNVDDPIHGFRDSLETYHHLRLMGELDSRSQQMADNFTTVLALAQNTKEAAARPG